MIKCEIFREEGWASMGYTNRNHSHSLCLIVYDGLLQVAFCMILRN